MHMRPKKYRHCSNVWVEDACKALGHCFNLNLAVGAMEGDRLTTQPAIACSFQTNLMTDVKSMTIVPMHEWKMPPKYWSMLPS